MSDLSDVSQSQPEVVTADVDYRRLFGAMTSPCLILDTDLRIIEVNDAYLAATCRRRGEVLGRPLVEAFPNNPDDPRADGVENLRDSLRRVLESGSPDTMATQRHDIALPEQGFGERFWNAVNTPVLDQHGRTQLILHQIQDVTDYVREQRRWRGRRHRKEDRQRVQATEAALFSRAQALQRVNTELLEARDQLRRRALHDQLTGLLVREVFVEELVRALHRQTRHGRPLAVLFLDLDRLKHVNDSFGHSAGDALIRCAAQRLQGRLRPSDTVARIGGDEFVVLLDELHDGSEAVTVAERMLDALHRPCLLPAGSVETPSASIGVVVAGSRFSSFPGSDFRAQPALEPGQRRRNSKD